MSNITTLLNNNCLRSLPHCKVNFKCRWKDRIEAHVPKPILGLPDTQALASTSPLPRVAAGSQSHPLCLALLRPHRIRSLHASPSQPSSLLLTSLLPPASIYLPFSLFSLILLSALIPFRWSFTPSFLSLPSPSASFMAQNNSSILGSSLGGAHSRTTSRWQSLGLPPTTRAETSTKCTTLCYVAMVIPETQ